MRLNESEIAIVGLGLMGGSLAMRLQPRVRRLVAVDTDPQTLQLAHENGVGDVLTNDLQRGLRNADAVVLATPVGAILQILGELPDMRPDGCLVLDIGSTKRQIVAAMELLPEVFAAVGMHPLCGKETSGLKAASPELYEGQPLAICRTRRSTAAALTFVEEVALALGARPYEIDAALHDATVAATSHLPYIAATALMAVGQHSTASDSGGWELSASGFRDMTRLASSDPKMMLDIIQSPADEVAGSLRSYIESLEMIASWIRTAQTDELASWLRTSQDEHQRYVSEKWEGSNGL
ncbi:MAG: prephenate dehydrogenase [Candidatus Promineifilaceae bacterium]|nr:prephenate dehydrogenase [Candidatus Promineifilaceae bacterium]